MRIFLLANNPDISESSKNIIKNLKIDDDDIVVVFNLATCGANSLMPKIDIACFRRVTIIPSKYFGVDENNIITKTPAMADKFFFLNEHSNYKNIVNANNIHDEKYEMHHLHQIYKYGNIVYNCHPEREITTGMYYIFHFLNLYSDCHMYLIGYNMFNSNRISIHDRKRESEILSEMGKLDRVTILL